MKKEDLCKTFGERLKKCRKEKSPKMRQLDLGRLLYPEDAAIGDSTIVTRVSGWERGLAMPDCRTLCVLAQIFDVSTDYLLGLSDSKRVDAETIHDLTGLSADTVNGLIYDNEKKKNRDVFDSYYMDLAPDPAARRQAKLIDLLYGEPQFLSLVARYLYLNGDYSIEVDGHVLKDEDGRNVHVEELAFGRPPRKGAITTEAMKLRLLVKDIGKCLDEMDAGELFEDGGCLPRPRLKNR